MKLGTSGGSRGVSLVAVETPFLDCAVRSQAKHVGSREGHRFVLRVRHLEFGARSLESDARSSEFGVRCSDDDDDCTNITSTGSSYLVL